MLSENLEGGDVQEVAFVTQCDIGAPWSRSGWSPFFVLAVIDSRGCGKKSCNLLDHAPCLHILAEMRDGSAKVKLDELDCEMFTT